MATNHPLLRPLHASDSQATIKSMDSILPVEALPGLPIPRNAAWLRERTLKQWNPHDTALSSRMCLCLA